MKDDSAHNEFSWHSHPARERPKMAAIGLLIILGLCGAVLVAFGPYWTAGSLVVLLVSLNRFFLPSRFTMDSERITAKYPLRRMERRWTDIRRFLHDRHGGYLSTRSRASRMDAFSGMHLMFGSQRDQIIDRIRAHMAVSSSGQTMESSSESMAIRTTSIPLSNGGRA